MLFKFSDIAVINKIGLNGIMEIDIKEMIKYTKEINPNLEIFITSATSGESISKLINSILN